MFVLTLTIEDTKVKVPLPPPPPSLLDVPGVSPVPPIPGSERLLPQ